jgi:hypothetical protein
MNLIRRAWNWLYPPSGPKLRNKPGGMAWIKGLSNLDGEYLLNGRAVKTVRCIEDGKWEIDPPQSYPVQCKTYYVRLGVTANRGDIATVVAIRDGCLEPWKEDGVTDSEVRELYDAPPVKQKESA